MTTIQLRSKVDPNGVLHLCVPFGERDAHREVRVTVQPLDDAVETLSPEQWYRFVHEMAGCIDDPTFQRHPQGDFENRKELFP